MADVTGGAAQRILVTGATGFIASHVVLALLQRGYEVRGTARSLPKAQRLNSALSTALGREIVLDMVETDLARDAGWAEAAQGCGAVMHIASPLPTGQPVDANQLIIPARDGALRVLTAAHEAGAKRVVMTSSMAAVAYGHAKPWPAAFDETYWSDGADQLDTNAYTRSKTLAERAAWDFVTKVEGDLELVSLNPGAVLGPALNADVSASLQIVLQPLRRALPRAPRIGFPVVDVRDVAEAHCLALEKPEAAGERYLLSGGFMWFREVLALLDDAYPERRLPRGELPDWAVRLASVFLPMVRQILPELGQVRNVSSAKAQSDLGWRPRSPGEAALASAESLVRLGVV